MNHGAPCRSLLASAILEMADGMHRAGITDDNAHAKIMLRHLGKPTYAAESIGGEEVRQVR